MAEESEIAAWFEARVPAGWYQPPLEVQVDGDEVVVGGRLAGEVGKGAAAEEARIASFREETREQRVRLAEEAQRRFRRKVSWSATAGETRRPFTTLSMPVMTRLRQPERQVLDTLIAAGVARSRSEALNWCVRLVAARQADWLADLKSALAGVEAARAKGPNP